jgi:hypothetical protein
MGVFGAANGDGDDGASMVITIKFLRKEIEKKRKRQSTRKYNNNLLFISFLCFV